MPDIPPERRGGTAFLLAQLGAHAAEKYAEAIDEIELTPPLTGILWVLSSRDDLSQQELARTLGMLPSRVVAYVDDLEGRGWVERVRSTVDRRANVLVLTDTGRKTLQEIMRISQDHERRMTSALSATERTELAALLVKIADHEGLTPGVHPGFRRLRPRA